MSLVSTALADLSPLVVKRNAPQAELDHSAGS